MTRLPLCVLLLVAVAPTSSTAADAEPGDDGLVPMFNGKSFDGWKKVGGGATYAIEGDDIVGKVGPGSNEVKRLAERACAPSHTKILRY